MIDQTCLDNAVHLLRSHLLSAEKFIRCFQKRTDFADKTGTLYTFFHIEVNGQLCALTYVEDLQHKTREFMARFVDKAWMEKWELYHWEPTNHVNIDRELVLEMLKNAK